MTRLRNQRFPLEDVRVPTRFKLSALWAATMFLYVYGDYFGLYEPAQLKDMLAGHIGALASQGVLLGFSAMMAAPSAMVFLSLVLPAAATRWTNITLGVVYSFIVLATMPGSWPFYLFLSAIEVAFTTTIAWQAWRWPRMHALAQSDSS